MTALIIMLVAIIVLGLGGRFYARFLARAWGEDPSRPTPAVTMNDGIDYVPTPTPVVFAHHYASIAGAGPIVGPVIALCFGWLPALVWILLGSVFIGGVHDYLATYMTLREGGTSIATVARRLLGKGPFIGLILFLILSLALVCATFLNLSAKALTSMVPFARLDLPVTQTLFRTAQDGSMVIVGGIASTSVIVITALAPLVGWLYLKQKVAVWKCSLLAVLICAGSIVVGLIAPVALSATVWTWVLAGYVLLAAGLPVWIFLQSRDFINVHILYLGILLLLITLIVAGLRGAGPAESSIPAVATMTGPDGANLLGSMWPVLFITVACGAVSGFHALCAGGTTCKQLTAETAARKVGYWGMLLEGFLAVCVIAVLLIGAGQAHYLEDIHPQLLFQLDPVKYAHLAMVTKGNPILGFSMAVGNAGHLAWGIPISVGVIAGMVMIEGFLVTTLDTAVRLMRYLFEELWRSLFHRETGNTTAMLAVRPDEEDLETGGSSGIPSALPERHHRSSRTHGLYWINSGLAVGVTLLFALTGGVNAIWQIFGSANQLLAALVLMIGANWLIDRNRAVWYLLLPAVFMMVTTITFLVMNLPTYASGTARSIPLLTADLLLLVLAAYLIVCTIIAVVQRKRRGIGSDDGMA